MLCCFIREISFFAFVFFAFIQQHSGIDINLSLILNTIAQLVYFVLKLSVESVPAYIFLL